MVLPNMAFDALMWGLLLVAALVDGAFPASHGFFSLLVLVGATYWAAQELGEFLTRRVGWSQESLATSLAPCAALFIYFLGRNSSDFSLLLLSIALMMGSLMVTISLLAAVSMLVREGRSSGLTGWIATSILSLCLGVAAGVAAILLGLGPNFLIYKIGALVGAFVLWKLREKLSPPPVNPHAPLSTESTATAAPVRPALFPQRGTLLDRLIPVAILGVLLALGVMRGTFSLGALNQPAAASQSAQPSQQQSRGTAP
jgi:vacuolar-type H+-ATPase subunit I/STV1